MRAQSSVKVSSSLVVVVLALVNGCSPDEPRVVAVVPGPLAPEPELHQPQPQLERELIEPGERPVGGQSQVEINAIHHVPVHQDSVSHSDMLAQIPRNLVFECTDDVNFSVRMSNSGLRLFPPGMPPGGYLMLGHASSEAGVLHYRTGDIDLRIKDDLATLQVGRERYVDCVSNPAAAVWQAPLRSTTPR